MISELVEMLGYCRPAFSETEEAFIERFLEPLGVMRDNFGNIIKQVGEDANIMFSSHTDTVHRSEGRVPILVEGNVARVMDNTGASCLGADCTTGVWLMMEMIRHKRPGLYVFHRAEEQGCQGSEWIVGNNANLTYKIDACIAFDRYGLSSVITHQMGERTCSDRFADSLIDQLPGFEHDDGGSYTDSYTYRGLISECTNLSVGYYNQHQKLERQNLSFAATLRDWLIELDTSKLIFDRDPTKVEPMWWDHYPDANRHEYITYGNSRQRSLTSLIRDYPAEAADLMELYGIDADDFLSHIQGTYGFYANR